MKILFLIAATSFSMITFATDVIEPAPLSIEDDGARKIKTRIKGEPADISISTTTAENAPEFIVPKVEPIEELAPVPTSVGAKVKNSIDGQLKFAESMSHGVPPEEISSSEDVIIPSDVILNKYIQLSFGYVNSRYEKFHSALDNGSTFRFLKYVQDFNQNIQSGVGIGTLTDTSEQESPDNVRIFQLRVFAEYHSLLYQNQNKIKVDWVGGLHLSSGQYTIRRHFKDASGQEFSERLKKGRAIGIIPTAGLRFYLYGKNSIDLMAEYHQYIGKYPSYIGGLAISPRLNFEF